MKLILRPLAIHAAYSPIETIVFFCIVATLAYFQILSAIKHSAFLAPSPPLRPAHLSLRQGEWVTVRDNAWFHAKSAAADDAVIPVEIQQVVFELDGMYKAKEVRHL